MDRNLAMEFVRVTEAAALNAAGEMGRGDELAAEQAGVSATRSVIDSLPIRGKIIIGHGEAPDGTSLEVGQPVGTGEGDACDVAVDPLEGTGPCASGRHNALSCIVAADEGAILPTPEIYMDKIACGAEAAEHVSLDRTPGENVKAVADALGTTVDRVTVAILDRPRHKELIDDLRGVGARIRLLLDGDLAGAIATATGDTGVDLLLGVGGAREGVIAAGALKCLGGGFQGRFIIRQGLDDARVREAGIEDIRRIYTAADLVRGDAVFAATGVTNGDLLRGVRFFPGGAKSHSLVMRSKSGTIRYIETRHHFEHQPNYA